MFEFLKQPGVYEVALIILGMFSYKIISGVVGYMQLHEAVRTTSKLCLFVIARCINSEISFREKLYEDMEKMGEPQESIDKLKENELLITTSQADRMVKALKDEFPKEYHKLLPFDDWKTGMAFLFEKPLDK